MITHLSRALAATFIGLPLTFAASSAFAVTLELPWPCIDLANGTEASFLHLKAGSLRVAPGDFVRQGDPVAEVGNSGYICGTHLHFQIQQICTSWWCQSVSAATSARASEELTQRTGLRGADAAVERR